MSATATHKDRVREHFDRWSDSYDRGQITRWLRAFQQRTIDAMDLPPDARVLDVGCGTGWAVVRLAGGLPGGEACGVDLSPGMIDRARERGRGVANASFRVGDAENIPYEDGRFDAVMCSSSFHHYPRPVRALEEFRRVLRKGGSAWVLDPCRDGSLLIKLFDLGHKVFVGDHVRYYATAEIRRFFVDAGFADVREVFREQRLFHNGKLVTSETLVTGRKG